MSIQKPTETKVKETDLRSQTFTDFQDFQHLRGLWWWFPLRLDMILTHCCVARQRSSRRKPRHLHLQHLQHLLQWNQQSWSHSKVNQPSWTRLKAKPIKKENKSRNAVHYEANSIFLADDFEGHSSISKIFATFLPRFGDPYLHRSRREFNRILSEILN